MGQQQLKDSYKDYFKCGVAVAPLHLQEGKFHQNLIATHFNSIVAENVMKPEKIQPVEGTFTFEEGDKIIAFAQMHHMSVRGHTLLWHQQTPEWMFEDGEGKQVSREQLLNRIRTHIMTTMTHYKGQIEVWDVVNEVISDEGEYRESKYFKIIGLDYIETAFKIAKEADPNAKLFINDYGIEGNCPKRTAIYKLVKALLEKGVPIDGIGIQCHINEVVPDLEELRETIHLFAALGLEVQITELDISLYTDKEQPSIQPNREILEKQAIRYANLFQLLREEKEYITNVTFWGISDDISWLNNFPTKGRGDAPLLFDTLGQAKPALKAIIEIIE